jgi:hypothetical protein
MNPLEMLRYHVTGAIVRGDAQPIVDVSETYCKIRFVSKHHGKTAGLIVPASKLQGKTIADLSRYFPMSECRKMYRLERSPFFTTWDEAFNYEFK